MPTTKKGDGDGDDNDLTTPLLNTATSVKTNVTADDDDTFLTNDVERPAATTGGGTPDDEGDDGSEATADQPTSRIAGTCRLLNLTTPHYRTLIVGCVVLLLRLPFSLFIPDFVSRVLGSLGEGDYDKATQMIMWLTIVGTVDSVLDFGCIYFFGAAQNRMVRDLRVDTFAAILRQEVSFFDKVNSGELVSRLTSDCSAMSGDLTWFFRFSIEASVRITFIAVYMLLKNLKLAGAALGIIPVIAFLNKLYGDWLAQNAKEVQESLAKATSVAQESLANVRTVIAFANEDKEVHKYEKVIEENYKLTMTQLIATGLYYMTMSTFLVNTCIQAVLLYLGMRMVKAGTLDTTTLLAFMLYQGQLQNYTLQLFQSYSALIKSAGAGDHVFALLDRKVKQPGTGHPNVQERIGRSDDESTTPKSNSLTFTNVNFVYPTRKTNSILQGLSLHVPSGTTMALVGPSGCGKSTIVNLIERFYDPFPGRILVGDTDLRNLDISRHRKSIGIVTQEPCLFSGTILSNIIYGSEGSDNSSISAADAIFAAKRANAHDFITSFPDGYETVVGERGVQLSGGQKQRIAIARAIVKKPQILLLDEATSALDSESERLVQHALDQLMTKNRVDGSGMTVVVIAHRLQTVRKADCISVMLPGKGVVERGTHEELMGIEGGQYRALVEAADSSGVLPD
eukprot:CAMPEP_0172485112 /NCGR_PEP_ID=MMETSP1066-20121228/12923_1 /TAXON_ID=671091 /ORGANISM="Coscinodiscus wailesii, Strain CCMP2513" /LENGTH=680 /DNA_ID=CAMNT_0013250083 /DNA_START=81 /DNA_END=2123 /DNA_ORIENTATION=+